VHQVGYLHGFFEYVLKASLMMTPWDRNMWLYAYFIYKVVFSGYLFIPYCIGYYNGIRLGLGKNMKEPQL